MKKFLLVSALSLIFGVCIAQNHGVSVSYVPWGYERLSAPDFIDTTRIYTWKGYHSFLKPALKLDFEIHWGITVHLVELAYSTVDAQVFDPNNINYGMDNIKQIGLFWRPGFVFLPERRVQIPVFGGMGLNCYFGDIPLLFQFDLSLMAQLKVYVINQLALFAGYSMHYAFGKRSTAFKHYPEIGLIYEF